MIENISNTYPKARKQYKCSNIDYVLSGVSVHELMKQPWTDKEREILHKAVIIDDGKIQVGEVYNKQINKLDGEIYTYRAKIESTIVLDRHGYLERDL